jgi:hypothetical protein
MSTQQRLGREALALCAALLSAACLNACGSERAMDEDAHQAPVMLETTTQPSEVSRWLGDVRAAHVAAKSASAAGDLQRQVVALDALVATARQVPPSVLALDEADGLRRDSLAVAAGLATRLKRFDQAQALVREGLQLPGHDGFRVQLLIVSAELYRAIGDAALEADALAEARAALGTH